MGQEPMLMGSRQELEVLSGCVEESYKISSELELAQKENSVVATISPLY